MKACISDMVLGTSAAEVDEFILNDPFFKQQLADYKTMQLEPTGFGPQFNKPS